MISQHDKNLQGRLIVVTGGGAGIGLGISQRLAQIGASVIVAELSDQARPTIDSLRSEGLDLRFVSCDIGKEASIDALFKVVADDSKPLYGLVNNAGVTIHGDFLDFTMQDWEQVVNVNLRSVFLCSQRAAKLMQIEGGGSIVNIASNHAGATNPGFEAYAATKGGVLAMTRAMAWSLGSHGIRVNSLSPGLTETSHIHALIEREPALGDVYRSLHATQRFNQTADIADIAAFLLCDASIALTGIDVLADNGMSARLFQRT
ncbi:SDR family oxidoreductase [Comamonas sp. JUb58]|uniref:SDR family NAD(P)-dependent oxidoreductase n=1 Tax=Comamonas sp. JUb58 TaxID=2485114 RepID=UPI00106097D0|nr:SDR family oxidoreductase [Comamonas sp. JUb58]TDS70424.1 3-oxoacyl-[acyl-carrier protein] reductase [Comamonas sp. JUb58]